MRLSTPASSFTAKRGTLVRGFLLESPQCDGIPVLPTRTPVEGRVLSVHRVGLGLWHETASLEIAFLRLLPAGADPIEINGRLKLVDNARETVRNGVIRGIRSTDTPQGTISSRLKYLPSIHLYPDPYLLGYKMLFPIFPDPEINLEAGTDIEVELAETAKLPDDLVPVSPIPLIEHDSELEHDLTDLPERTLTKKGKEADVVNIVFAGLRDDLEEAFTVAGWHQSGLTSTRSVTRQFYSFLSKSSYAAAPMSTQLLEGRKPDLALEKVFQSYEKRNHLRIWLLENTWEGFPLWASAAVRETGATLLFRQMGFYSPHLRKFERGARHNRARPGVGGLHRFCGNDRAAHGTRPQERHGGVLSDGWIVGDYSGETLRVWCNGAGRSITCEEWFLGLSLSEAGNPDRAQRFGAL